MKNNKPTYEVVIEKGGQSSIESVYEERKKAIDRADYLLRLARYTRIRVISASRLGEEVVHFDRSCATSTRSVQVSQIHDAAHCESLSDVYAFESRQTILRVLRGYLDEKVCTPTELLHNYEELRDLERRDVVFRQALTRVAAIQARKSGIEESTRVSQLSALFAELAKAAKSASLPAVYQAALTSSGITGVISAVAASGLTEPSHQHVSYAFAMILRQHRDWRAKLRCILTAFSGCFDSFESMADEFIAETIGSTDAIRALIGYAPDLGSATLSLLSTLTGTLDDRLPSTDELLDLSEVLKAPGFHHTRETLLRHIQGVLEGNRPLSRAGRADEARSFRARPRRS